MNDTTEPRYIVEQLGHSDYGVWDNDDDKWVFEGGLADCEDAADRLNEEHS